MVDYQMSTFLRFYNDMTKDGVKFKYALPEHISIGDKGSSDDQLTLYNGSGTAIGTYYIKDDIIYVTYPGYYNDCTTRFTLDASWADVDNVSEVNVEWPDKTDKFKIENTSLLADKSAVKYTEVTNPDSDYIYTTQFKVTATAKEKVGATGLNGIKLSDTMNNTKMVFMDKQYTDAEGNAHDFMVVRYDIDEQPIRTEYYDKDSSAVTFSETKSGSTTETRFTIDGLSLNQGEHLSVYYTAGIKKEQSMLVMAEGDNYTNRAEFSYPYVNPKTGARESQTVSATDTGHKGKDAKWLCKSTPNDRDISYITIGEDMKSVAKYKVTVNSGFTENVGGSSLNDKISMSAGDKAKGYTIGYYTYNAASATYNNAGYKPKVTSSDASGNSSTKDLSFLTVSEALYNRVKAYHASDSGLQADKLLADSSLISDIAAATGVTINAGNVSDYIFAYEGADEFVWFVPKSDEITAYELTYYSCADAAVSNYTNGVSCWFKTVFSTEPGDATPVVIRFATSKHNGGVQKIGDNYYVDYEIDFAMGENSGALYDWNLTDYFPKYKVTWGGRNVQVYDWLTGLSESSLSLQDGSGAANAAAIKGCFEITTDSDREDVQEMVRHITVGHQALHWIDLKSEPYNNIRSTDEDGKLNQLLASEISGPDGILYDDRNRSINNGDRVYAAGTDGAMAGQFVSDATRPGGSSLDAINEGDRYSLGGVVFFVGDMPDTLGGKEEYSVNIKYRMQINPYLVENLPQQLQEENKTEVKLENEARWFSEYSKDVRNLHPDAIGTAKSRTLRGQYTIGAEIPEDVIDKTLTKGYDSTDNSMTYEVKVNENKNLLAINQKYRIHDNLSMVGVKYMPGTLEVKDEDDKIVYTEITGHSVDTAYTGLATYTPTNNENESNSFDIELNNEGGAFTDSNLKFKALTISYKLDVSEVVSSTSELSNSASLQVWEPESSNVPAHWKNLGQSDTSNSIAKALDKVLTKAPSGENDYKAEYKIKVDPNSPNSKELKDIAAEASAANPKYFTLEDTFDDSLTLDLDSVKIYQVQSGSQTDITAECEKTYDSRNRIFNAKVKMTDPDATYLITYSAITMGVEFNKLATLSNTAKIKGTAIEEEKTQDQVYIYQYSGDASATAPSIKLCKYDEADITKRLQASFDLYRYNYTDTEEDRENSINTPKATSADGAWRKIEVTPQLQTDATTGEIVLKDDVIGSSVDRKVEYDTWYRLDEVAAPDGYAGAAPYYYYVYGDGRNSDKIPVDADGKYSVIIPAKEVGDEPPVIYIGNGSLSLSVLKVDSTTKDALQGANFGLYSDAACSTLLKSGTTGEDGKVIFNDLTTVAYPGDVYLKETKAPTDYKKNNKVYKISLNGLGQITAVINVQNSSDTLTFDADTARITVPNGYNYSYLSVSKEVQPVSAQSSASFSFVIKLRDTAGNRVTKKYAANKILSGGTTEEVPGGYISDTVITLKHGEKFELPKIDRDITYTIEETEDRQYNAKYSVKKTSGDVETEDSGEGRIASGDIAKGDRAEVKYTNTRKTSLIVRKEVERADGGEVSIPVGHVLSVRSSWLGGTVYASARWNGTKYESISVADGITFSTTDANGNEIEQGYRLTGMSVSSDASIYLAESNAGIEGYVCVLDRHDAANPNGRWMGKTFSGVDRVDTLKNTYYKAEASANLAVTKKLIGRTLAAGDYSFRLREKQSDGGYNFIRGEKTNASNGNVSFDPIQYTTQDLTETDGEGNTTELDTRDFYYMIEEDLSDAGSHPEITYDSKNVYAKVTVSRTKNDAGVTTGMTASTPIYYDKDPEAADAQEISGDMLTFTNAYKASGDITFKASKTVEGREAVSSKFGFTITEYTDNTFSTPINGTEERSIVSRGTNDRIDKDHTGEVTFGKIEYALTSNRETGETNKDTVLGDHFYIIREVIPDGADSSNKLDGWTYDDTEYEVRVNVSDAGNGKLTTTVYDDENKELDSEDLAGEFTFTNSYEASGKMNLMAVKGLRGRTLKAGETFTFKADELLQDSTKSPDKWDVKAENAATGTTIPREGEVITAVTLSDIELKMEDVGKTLYYRISEVAPAGATDRKLKGVTYSDEKFFVVVFVRDLGNGNIVGNPIYYTNDGSSMITMGVNGYPYGPYLVPLYVNDYHARGDVTFELSKELLGRTLGDEDDFTFTVDRIDADGTVREEGVATGRMENFAGKTRSDITFTSITYDETDAGKTYYYRITENIPAEAENNELSGVTYTTKPIIATVKVTDAGDGTLDTAVSYEEEDIFTNLYKAVGGLTLKADKVLKRMELSEGQFKFELCEGDKVIAEATNDADGNIVFDALEYDLDDLGTKTYTIREVIPTGLEIEDGAMPYTYGDESGWMTYDAEIYTVKVDIEDGRNGLLKVTVDGATRDEDGTYKLDYETEGDKAKEAAFVNTFSKRKAIDVTFEGKKLLENNKLRAKGALSLKDLFKFDINEVVDGKFIRVGGGTTDADGNIIFDKISYEWKDIGVHEYVITENTSKPVAGVLFDKSATNVTVTVSDNGDGSMRSDVAYNREGKTVSSAEFTNKSTETRFQKTDEGGNSLEGAVIRIEETDGTVIKQFVSSGKVDVVYGLECGKDYIMREVEAPKGYELADAISFRLGEDGKAYVNGQEVDVIKMVDKEAKVTTQLKTGDDAKLMLTMFLMTLSLLIIIVLLRKKTKLSGFRHIRK